MSATLTFDSMCVLGEGPLWHPARQELFWFDIERNMLLAARFDEPTRLREWHFPDSVTVAGILDGDRLLIAGASGLMLFDIGSGTHGLHVRIEDRPANRSNDGRVHPSGTLWVSTMGRNGEDGAGAIYAYRRGRLVSLFDNLTIPNAICFSPDGRLAYFADTPTGHILRCALDPGTGLPQGDPELFVDTSDIAGAPDGAVVDSAGHLWNARYGGGRVVRFSPSGEMVTEILVPAENVTCPAFAGSDLTRLVVTTAGRGAPSPAGGVFALEVLVPGLTEPTVCL